MAIILTLLILQRLGEMRMGRRNLSTLRLLVPFPKSEAIQMLILHTGFFISTIVEYQLRGQQVSTPWFVLGVMVLLSCQVVRLATMRLLGPYWTPYPVSFELQNVISHGPYRWIRHPNYLAVMIEIAVVPLLGGCVFTAIIFSFLNFTFLLRRMKMEEQALSLLPSYQRSFAMKKRLIPFIFSFLFVNLAAGGTQMLNYKDFEEASHAPTYFMFTGVSKKLGFISTSFEGYAKKATLSWDDAKEKATKVKLVIDAKELDTDSEGRNEKMQELCLASKEHPTITVTIPEVNLAADSQEVPGEMLVRGKTVPLKLQLTKDGEYQKGKTSFKLSEAGIPDPSIAIASVKDEFEIEFRVKVP